MMFLQHSNTWFWGGAEGELIKLQRQGVTSYSSTPACIPRNSTWNEFFLTRQNLVLETCSPSKGEPGGKNKWVKREMQSLFPVPPLPFNSLQPLSPLSREATNPLGSAHHHPPDMYKTGWAPYCSPSRSPLGLLLPRSHLISSSVGSEILLPWDA